MSTVTLSDQIDRYPLPFLAGLDDKTRWRIDCHFPPGIRLYPQIVLAIGTQMTPKYPLPYVIVLGYGIGLTTQL